MSKDQIAVNHEALAASIRTIKALAKDTSSYDSSPGFFTASKSDTSDVLKETYSILREIDQAINMLAERAANQLYKADRKFQEADQEAAHITGSLPSLEQRNDGKISPRSKP